MQLTFLAVRNLASRRMRTALTVIAIGLGIGLALGTTLATGALRDRSSALAGDLFGRADVVVRSYGDLGLDQQFVDGIGRLPEVEATASQLTKRTAVDVAGSREFVLLEGIDITQERAFHDFNLQSGRPFRPDEHTGVVITPTFAADHSLHVGSTLRMFTAAGLDTFSVVGVLDRGGLAETNSGRTVFVSLDTAQALFSLGARVEQVEVRLHDPSALPAFGTDIAAIATQDYSLVDRASVTAQESRLLQGVGPLLGALSLVALFVGVFLCFNTMAMEASERRREVALLRAAGATARQVGVLFMVQALWLGVLGSLLGVVIGFALGQAALVVSTPSGEPVPVLPLDPGSFALSLLLGIGLCQLAGVAPARRSMRVAPVEALRPSEPLAPPRVRPIRVGIGVVMLGLGVLLLTSAGGPAYNGPGAMLLLIGLGLLLPVYLGLLVRVALVPVRMMFRGESELAARSLLRRRSRTSLTVAGIAVACAALVALGGLARSARDESGRWVDSLFVGPYLMVSPVAQPLSMRDQFVGIPGVAAVTPTGYFTVVFGDRVISAAAVEPVAYASAGRLRFVKGDPQQAMLALTGTGILLPVRTASALGVTLGDTVALSTAQGSRPFTVAGILYHSLPAPDGSEAALMSYDTAGRYFGVTHFNLLQVVPGGRGTLDLEALRQEALLYGMELVPESDLRQAVDRGLAQALAVLEGLALVGVLVALLGIVNTLAMNANEGRREFGLLRAVGLSRRQLRRMVLAEAALTGLAGVLLGLVSGLVALLALLRGTSTASFAPGFEAPGPEVVAILGGVVLGCLLAAWIPARRAARLSIVAALREE
ncbi:MAG: ABC transporter permease [Candidatus Dormibacteria bacterium]